MQEQNGRKKRAGERKFPSPNPEKPFWTSAEMTNRLGAWCRLETERKPQGQLSVITPPSAPSQRQDEATKIPPSTKKSSSKAKQSQERARDRSRRRPRRSRTATSHGINSRSSDRYLKFANAQSPGPSRAGVQRCVNAFTQDDSSKHTCSYNTDPESISNQILLPVPGQDQANLPESSDHIADPEATPESKLDWMSTAYATTKLVIDLLKESSAAFPPLQSAAGGLSAILKQRDVRSISPKSYRP